MSEIRALPLTDVVDRTKLSEPLGDAVRAVAWGGSRPRRARSPAHGRRLRDRQDRRHVADVRSPSGRGRLRLGLPPRSGGLARAAEGSRRPARRPGDPAGEQRRGRRPGCQTARGGRSGHASEGRNFVRAVLALPAIRESDIAPAWALHVGAALAGAQIDHGGSLRVSCLRMAFAMSVCCPGGCCKSLIRWRKRVHTAPCGCARADGL